MRALTALFGSALLFGSAVASVSACSSDDDKKAPVSTEADGGDDATTAPADGGDDDTDAAQTGGSDGGTEAGVVEQVTARFGGTTYKLKVVTAAEVNGEGVAVVSAYEDIDGGGGAAIDLFFDPKTGTTSCGAGSKATVVFAAFPEEIYRANDAMGACSVVVTAFGAAGSVMSGTFTATTQKGGESLQGNGSFNLTRVK